MSKYFLCLFCTRSVVLENEQMKQSRRKSACSTSFFSGRKPICAVTTPHYRCGKGSDRVAEGLKIRGASSDVVGIICPIVEIGLTDLPKSGGRTLPRPDRFRHPCCKLSNNNRVIVTYKNLSTLCILLSTSLCVVKYRTYSN